MTLPHGRPTKYKPEYDDIAYKLCLLGHTDAELGSFFEVDERTINNWKIEHPNFFQSLKKGKEIADMEVAVKLLERAKGANVVRQQAIKMKETQYNTDGKKISEEERIEVVDLIHQEAPDTTALIFWLKNRKSVAWRDKQEITTISDDKPTTINLVMPDDNS
ncbi:MAG: hypothetical protein [Caudoviricetes sp.]|nr:MAG: hypothetical protein [Caudoviricetes sp.]